eukprot:NODE_687_length_5167_cov_0.378453.p4 type:complete len:123 gc:universal NODE_687_length_5167_cov_0.378453:195-563(+)
MSFSYFPYCASSLLIIECLPFLDFIGNKILLDELQAVTRRTYVVKLKSIRSILAKCPDFQVGEIPRNYTRLSTTINLECPKPKTIAKEQKKHDNETLERALQKPRQNMKMIIDWDIAAYTKY